MTKRIPKEIPKIAIAPAPTMMPHISIIYHSGYLKTGPRSPSLGGSGKLVSSKNDLTHYVFAVSNVLKFCSIVWPWIIPFLIEIIEIIHINHGLNSLVLFYGKITTGCGARTLAKSSQIPQLNIITIRFIYDEK